LQTVDGTSRPYILCLLLDPWNQGPTKIGIGHAIYVDKVFLPLRGIYQLDTPGQVAKAGHLRQAGHRDAAVKGPREVGWLVIF